MTGKIYLVEFLLFNYALLGAALFYWSKPLARAINNWTVRIYARFPKLKILPGSQNAGTELNYRTTSICFRICGALIVVAGAFFIVDLLQSLRR